MKHLLPRSANFRFSLLSGFVVLFALSGCVTAGKYHDLEDQSAKTQASLTQCESDRAELQKKLGVSSTEKTELEGSVADMKKALAEADARKAETEKRLAEFRELTSRFKELVDAGKLSIKFQNGRMLIALSTDILFPSGSAQLSKEGKESIATVAGLLKDLNNRNFQIEGHTDNVPIHTKQFPSNWELASARAGTVLNTMLAAGFPPEHISTASYGSYEPVGDNSDPKGRSENRRIAIAIVPDLSGLPGFEELNRMSGGKETTSTSSPDATTPTQSTTPAAGSSSEATAPTKATLPTQPTKETVPTKPTRASANEGNPDIQKNAAKDVHTAEVPPLPDNATKNVAVPTTEAN